MVEHDAKSSYASVFRIALEEAAKDEIKKAHPYLYDQLSKMTAEEFINSTFELAENFPREVVGDSAEKRASPIAREKARARAALIDAKDVKVKFTWTGLQIFLSHAVLQRIEGGTVGAEALGAAIAVGLKAATDAFFTTLTALFGPVSAAFAVCVLAKIAEFFAADLISGERGVWVPITWPQIPAMTLPGLAAVYIHPLPADAPFNPWGL